MEHMRMQNPVQDETRPAPTRPAFGQHSQRADSDRQGAGMTPFRAE